MMKGTFFCLRLVLAAAMMFMCQSLVLPSTAAAQSTDDLEDTQNISNILLITGVGLAAVAIIWTVATRDKRKRKPEEKDDGAASDSTSSQIGSLQHRMVPGESSDTWQARLEKAERQLPLRIFVAPAGRYDQAPDDMNVMGPQSLVVGLEVKF